MLKACVSYSKKVPVDGLDFSSQGYSLTLETEIPESNPADIQAKLHDTFELVKTQVETELSNGSPKAASQPADNTGGAKPQGPVLQAKASNKQIKFITDLASRQGISLGDLNARIQERFGVDGLYDLDKKQASAVVDGLKKAA